MANQWQRLNHHHQQQQQEEEEQPHLHAIEGLWRSDCSMDMACKLDQMEEPLPAGVPAFHSNGPLHR
jgi:hypothetical protein